MDCRRDAIYVETLVAAKKNTFDSKRAGSTLYRRIDGRSNCPIGTGRPVQVLWAIRGSAESAPLGHLYLSPNASGWIFCFGVFLALCLAVALLFGLFAVYVRDYLIRRSLRLAVHIGELLRPAIVSRLCRLAVLQRTGEWYRFSHEQIGKYLS